MTNRHIFLDSSILIEYYKNTQTELLDELLKSRDFFLCISQVVLSEYLYHCIGYDGGKAPRTLQGLGKIKENILYSDHPTFLRQFEFLEGDANLISQVVTYMASYNLLTNDALILAICQLQQIPAIASYDPDFEDACKGENMKLLQSIKDFEKFRKN